MTVVNPKSISGINSITTGSGSDNLLTIHTSDASSTERVRINSSGDVIVGSGITVSPDGDIFATGVCTATSFVGSGANLTGVASTENIRTNTNATFLQNINVSGTSTVGGDLNIADKIVHIGDTNTAIRFPEADTVTFETAGFEQVRIDNDVQMFVEANSKQAKLQLHREDTSVAADDVIGQITFTGRDSGGAGTQRVGAAISAIASNAWDTGQATGYSPAHLDFFTQNNSGVETTLTPRVRIDSSGRVLIGTTDVGGGNADDLTVATSGNTGITIRSGTSNTGNIFWSDATSGADQYIGALEYHHSDNQFKFNISNTTRMTVDSTGDVTISDGDLVIGTSGHGIDFSATSDASGKTSELLDDYEEGTWSPVWSDATSGGTTSVSNQMHGRYTKIGRMVTAHFFTWGLPSQGTSNAIILQGLPYAAGEIGEIFGSVQAGYYNDGNTSTYNLGVFVTSGNTYGYLVWNNAGNNDVTSASFSGFINGYTNFTGTLTYLVA